MSNLNYPGSIFNPCYEENGQGLPFPNKTLWLILYLIALLLITCDIDSCYLKLTPYLSSVTSLLFVLANGSFGPSWVHLSARKTCYS